MTTESFPFAINGIIGQRWTSTSDSNLRILFGIRGSWQILIKDAVYEMSAEDVLVLNAFQTAQATAASADSALFLIEIYREEIENQLNVQWTPVFDCNSMAENQFVYQEKEFSQLREKLLACLATFYDLRQRNQFAVYEKFFSMLSFLKSHFQKADFQLSAAYDEKIQQVLSIIHLNYMKPLTLKQIADATFLSYHYLSRKFKEDVGVSFKEYLTTYRLKKSASDLRISDQSILKIALENGFTNTKSFHLAFKNYYGTTPNDYRQQQITKVLEVENQKKQSADDFERLDIEAAMLVLSNFMEQKDPEDFLEPKQLERQISLNRALKSRSVLPKILNIGHCRNWLRGDVQAALLEAYQEIDFEYLRFSDVLIEKQHTIDTFEILQDHGQMDYLLSFAIEKQLTPIIHFKLPEDALLDQTWFHNWLEPRCQVLQRLVDEFGDVSHTWHLEFDLDPLLTSLKAPFLAFYQQMQKIFDQPTIGLNVGTLYHSAAVDQLAGFLADLNKQHLTIAFVSYRSDPSDGYLWDERLQNQLEEYQKYNLTLLKTLLDKYHYSGEIFLNEWNTLIGKGTTLRGTFFRAAIMLKDLLYLAAEIDGAGFWLNNSSSDEQTLIGQNRLTLYVGYQLKRPAFFALRLLDRMKGGVLYQEETIYLTQQGQTRYLLLLNPAYFNPAMSIDETYMMYQSQLIKLELLQLEQGTYQINTYTLDKDHGGIYNELLKTSGLDLVDQEVTNYLKQAVLPKLEVSRIEVTDHLTFKELLSFNACCLIQIKPLHL